MSVTSSVLGAVAIALVYFTSAVSSENRKGCDFLTFGQDMKLNDVASCAVLALTKGDFYCCYNALRQPYCCDQGDHYVNLIIWIVALVVILCSIIMIVRRIWFYRRAGRFFM